MKTALGFFAIILVGSLVSSMLGGLFAWVVATISPEFVMSLFSPLVGENGVARYAFSVGMIWGLFIGTAVAGFACILSVVLKLIRLRVEYSSGRRE